VAAKAAGVVACKLYPAGATTNSDHGVTDLRKIYPRCRPCSAKA
jgi:dihydroorotase